MAQQAWSVTRFGGAALQGVAQKYRLRNKSSWVGQREVNWPNRLVEELEAAGTHSLYAVESLLKGLKTQGDWKTDQSPFSF